MIVFLRVNSPNDCVNAQNKINKKKDMYTVIVSLTYDLPKTTLPKILSKHSRLLGVLNVVL